MRQWIYVRKKKKYIEALMLEKGIDQIRLLKCNKSEMTACGSEGNIYVDRY